MNRAPWPGVWSTLYVICRELQMPMDREKLARLVSGPPEPHGMSYLV